MVIYKSSQYAVINNFSTLEQFVTTEPELELAVNYSSVQHAVIYISSPSLASTSATVRKGLGHLKLK